MNILNKLQKKKTLKNELSSHTFAFKCIQFRHHDIILYYWIKYLIFADVYPTDKKKKYNSNMVPISLCIPNNINNNKVSQTTTAQNERMVY